MITQARKYPTYTFHSMDVICILFLLSRRSNCYNSRIGWGIWGRVLSAPSGKLVLYLTVKKKKGIVKRPDDPSPLTQLLPLSLYFMTKNKNVT